MARTPIKYETKARSKKWLRGLIDQLEWEAARAEEKRLARDEIKNPGAFLVQLLVGLVLIGYAAAIVIEVVALTS